MACGARRADELIGEGTTGPISGLFELTGLISGLFELTGPTSGLFELTGLNKDELTGSGAI